MGKKTCVCLQIVLDLEKKQVRTSATVATNLKQHINVKNPTTFDDHKKSSTKGKTTLPLFLNK